MDNEVKGTPVHLPRMMKANAVELQARIRSQIQNYEDLLHLITSIQASHAWVFKSMNVIVHTHAIPSLGTLTQAKTKNQVWQELDSYFDELMRTATNPNLPISVDIMCKYIFGPNTLKTMMHILSDELDREAWVVYLDAMEARFKFQMDVTVECMNTIKDYQYWNQYVTFDQHEDVKQLEFYGCLSLNDF